MNNLIKLVQNYPDHSFVIDYKETQSLFRSVRKNDSVEEKIGEKLDYLKYPSQRESIIQKIYPQEILDEQFNKSTSLEGIGKDKGRTAKIN